MRNLCRWGTAALLAGLIVLVGRADGFRQVPTKEQLDAYETERMNWVRKGEALWHGEPFPVDRPDLKVPSNGSTVGMACAMCHPDAADTNPETWPKYALQLSKLATLREQINWCVTRQLRAPALPHDGEQMLAYEAFIMHWNKGKAIDPGRH